METKRWANNPLLNTYDGVSVPVTGKDGVDYQMGCSQLAEVALKGTPKAGKLATVTQLGDGTVSKVKDKATNASGKELATTDGRVASVGNNDLRIVPSSNEINFGGEGTSKSINFGFSEIDNRPRPDTYIFNQATVRALKYVQNGKDVANVSEAFPYNYKLIKCENLTETRSMYKLIYKQKLRLYDNFYIKGFIGSYSSVHLQTPFFINVTSGNKLNFELHGFVANRVALTNRCDIVLAQDDTYLYVYINVKDDFAGLFNVDSSVELLLNESLTKSITGETLRLSNADNVYFGTTDSNIETIAQEQVNALAPAMISTAQRVGPGRNIVELLGASSVIDAFNKIHAMNGNYGILQLGDYIDLPTFTVPGVGEISAPRNRVEICGFNHYDKTGATRQLGVLFQWKNVAFLHSVNPTHTNDKGYWGCQLRTLLNGDFATALGTVVGAGNLREVKRLAEKHSSTEWWNNWVTEKAFLPTEVEVWGHQVWGNAGYSTGTSIQWPIFALDPSRRCKLYNGGYQYWWTATSCVKGDNEQPNSTYFSGVSSYGYANYYYAGNASGVAPAFYI